MADSSVKFLEKYVQSKSWQLYSELEKEEIFRVAHEIHKKEIKESLAINPIELLTWGISAEEYYSNTFKSE